MSASSSGCGLLRRWFARFMLACNEVGFLPRMSRKEWLYWRDGAWAESPHGAVRTLTNWDRPQVEAPLIVWEYAFALERRVERLYEAKRDLHRRTQQAESVAASVNGQTIAKLDLELAQCKVERHSVIQENGFMKNERKRLKSRLQTERHRAMKAEAVLEVALIAIETAARSSDSLSSSEIRKLLWPLRFEPYTQMSSEALVAKLKEQEAVKLG